MTPDERDERAYALACEMLLHQRAPSPYAALARAYQFVSAFDALVSGAEIAPEAENDANAAEIAAFKIARTARGL